LVVKGREQEQEEEEQKQQQRQQQPQEEQRVFLVTEGLRSKYTRTSYGSAFRQFKKFMEIQDERILASYKPSIIEQRIIRYLETLAGKGRAQMTIQLHKAAIFHFFEMNDVVLNKRKISRLIPQAQDLDNDAASSSFSSSLDRAYTVGEIDRIINEGCNDLRSKLMVTLMASTGMRVGAIYDLRFGDLVRLDKYPLYMIWVYARSKRDRYYTFATPECTELVDSYLDYRRRLGENITEKSPLIREMFDTNNPFIINQPKRLSPRMAQIVLEQALKRSGGLQSNGTVRRPVMRSHGFRKFAITQMKKAQVDFSDREYLVGHRASLGLDYNYDRTSVDDRLKEWSKAISLLTIDPNQRLEQENQELKSVQSEEIARLRWREGQLAQEVTELRSQLNEVQSQTKGIAEFVGWVKTYYDPHTGQRMKISSTDQSPREVP
jgi:integrase